MKNELSVKFYFYKQEFAKLKCKFKKESLIFHYFHNFMMKFWSHFTLICSFSPTRTVFIDLFFSINSLSYLLTNEIHDLSDHGSFRWKYQVWHSSTFRNMLYYNYVSIRKCTRHVRIRYVMYFVYKQVW